MNISISFNINVIKKVKSYHFQVDQVGSVLFILFALYENKLELLDEFDDNNKQRRALFLYKELQGRYLIQESEVDEYAHYSLTDEGRKLVEFVKNEHIHADSNLALLLPSLPKSEPIVDKDPNSPVNWIDQWIDLFPRGVKTAGKLVRSDRNGCLRKMEVFCKDYPQYTKEIIMGATLSYLTAKRQDGWNYTRCAIYFIYRVEKDGKVSDLAAECEQYLFKQQNGSDTQASENNMEVMV